MGTFISQIKIEIEDNKKVPKNKQQLKNSLSKIREFHGSFKSICDTFAIELSEYTQIFNNQDKLEESFNMWDKDKNGLIDALELFAGLILFSEDSFEDKIRFLFDIFDFNELNSLAVIDLEFMLISCANATFKIYDIQAEIEEQDVSDFLKKDFNDDARVNISQLLKWLSRVEFFSVYMKMIDKQLPENKQALNQDGKKNELRIKTAQSDAKSLPSIINNKKYQQQLDFLSNVSKKLFFLNQNHFSNSSKDIYCKVNWVYGFRSHDTKRPLEYIKHEDSEKYLYFTTNIIIIYFPQVNQQRHYLEHEQEVLSLAVSKNKMLVASGELGDRPAIHIWNSQTLQNLGVIKGIHQHGINQIKFFKQDILIASCGIRESTPILIYNVKDYSLVLSTIVNEFVISLMTIENYVGDFKEMYNQSSQDAQNQQWNNVYNNKKQKKVQHDKYEMFNDYHNNFIVCTKKQILFYNYSNEHFNKHTINLDEVTCVKPADLTCATAIRINSDQPYLKAYRQDDEANLVIITGHSDGTVYFWVNLDTTEVEKIEHPSDNAILNITTYTYGIIISTEASKIHLWDFNFKNYIKKIDMTSFQFKLVNYTIADVLVTQDKLLVSTKNGDIIEIKFNQKHTFESNQYLHKMNASRLNFITKLQGDLRAMCLLERPENDDKILFVSGSSTIVYGFSLETHEIVDIWSIGGEQQITCMDCINFEDGGTVFAIGCEGGKIYMRIDWEEQPRTYDCGKTINDLKFSSDCFFLIAAVDDNHIYVFLQTNNSYFQMHPKKIQFDNEIPISIDFVDDNKSFLVGTSIRNQYKVEIHDYKCKNLMNQNEKINCTIWNLRYPLHTKNQNYQQSLLPVIIGGDIKLFLCAGESGYLYYWRDYEQLESNCGGFLKGHSSLISRLLMTKSQDLFFSLGLHDHTIIEWKVDFINDFNDFSRPFHQGQSFQPQNQSVEKSVGIKDDILIRELAYSYIGKNNYLSDAFKDQFILFRGTNQKMLNQHLYNLFKDQGLSDENYLMKRPPPLSLQLDFIYGFQSFDKRRTLFYGHVYIEDNKDQRKKRNKKQLFHEEIINKLSKNKKILSYQQHKDINLTSQLYQPTIQTYDEMHESCKRYFVYYTSRIVIVYNPKTNKQRFYEGHRSKITALAMHPLKFYVASGEANLKPYIHIWNLVNCEPFKILPTFHKNGIIHMAFSFDASLIVSIGMDINFSIQVTNWKTEEIMALRNSGQYHLFDAQFNPFNRYEIATCGSQLITIWKLEGRNLMRKYVINVAEESMQGANVCVSCIAHMSYKIDNNLECDILAGNNFGELSLITQGKYITVKKGAHNNKMINCIKITEAFKGNIIIITSGEDEMINIWDTKFNKINSIQLRSLPYFGHLPTKNISEQRNISAQSIDIYICEKDKQRIVEKDPEKKKKDKFEFLQYKSFPKILIGTRNGDILEATFVLDIPQDKNKQKEEKKVQGSTTVIRNKAAYSDDSEDMSSDGDEEDEKLILKNLYGQSEKGFKFDSSCYLRSHQSQIFSSQNKTNIYDNMFSKKVYFALHPIDPIMVSVGEDQIMCLYDTAQNKLLDIKFLKNQPTAIKFSPDGEQLLIGFINGHLLLFDSKFKKNPNGKLNEKYEVPKMNFSKNLNDKATTAVLNIEFSSKGEMLAVSYDNAKNSKEFEGKLEKEGSYITIFSNRAQLKAKKTTEKSLYINYLDIRCPSAYESYNTESNAYGCAVYYMTFSQDENYILIYYQLIDNYLVRINNDSKGWYLIWDLINKMAVKSWDAIKEIQWKSFNFPNSLVSQYQYYSQLIMDDENKEQQQQSQNITPSFMSVMFDLRPYLIVGSIRGDLHFTKNSCLWNEQDFRMEDLKPDQMCLAKSYSAHVSFVNQCETTAKNTDYLFTSSITDECIMKWKLIQEEQHWDLDHIEYQIDQPDLYSELVTKDKFNNLQSEVLPLRANIAEAKSNVEETKQSPVELQLENIIGRKAYNRLNNLFYDYNENIVYLAGCNLVITNPREEEAELKEDETFHLVQEFIKLDQNSKSKFPEISCISLSKDKKFIVAGTIQIDTKILIWDICSRTCIKTMSLTNSTIVLLVKFAYNNRHIACVTLTKEYTLMVYLIDSQQSVVLGCANFPYSIPFKIKDMDFFPNSIYKFVTCGIQHMAIWTFQGHVLSFQHLEIENPKEIEDIKKPGQNEEVENKEDNQDKEEELKEDDEDQNKSFLRVSFLCVLFLEDLIITGGDDGFLYFWQDRKIKQKHLAHPKAPILSLSTQQNSNIFVSGGIDGRINLWQIQPRDYNFHIEKIQEYTLTKEETQVAIKNPENFVQSVCIGSKYILAGTKSGDVYELLRPQEQESDQKEKRKEKKVNVIKRLSAQDNEIPCSIAFSKDSDLIYTITQKGLFSVWDINNLERDYCKNFAKETHSLIVCKESPKIIIAFEQEIVVLSTEDSNYSFGQWNKLQLDSIISDMKMSLSEKMLAIALQPNKDQTSKIEIYDAANEENKFKLLCQIGSLTTQIDYLDFSTNNIYLLYKDNFEEVSHIDLQNLKKINTIFVEHDIQWCSDGIKVSEKTKGIQPIYGDENKILKIAIISDNAIVVTDEMGTVRIFNYPCESGAGNGYMLCYTDHLNYINQCVVSPNQKYLITCSEVDRCVFIWKIIQNNKHFQNQTNSEIQQN